MAVPAAVASLAPLEVSAQVTSNQQFEIVIDFVDSDSRLALAEQLWSLHEAGKLHKELAAEMKINRNQVTKLLKLAAARHGVELEDGRARHGRMKQEQGPPRCHERIAEQVMELVNQGLLLTDIAQQFGTHRDLITAAIRFWHESRNLPFPDGRTRRKSLKRKSSQTRRMNDQVRELDR